MMMKHCSTRLRALLLFLPFLLFIAAMAPGDVQAGPAWQGDPATTFQRFDLTTSDETVTPDVATNPLGIAEAVIEAVTPPGSGWQDPAQPFTTPGVNGGDGAWDLGPNGFIRVGVPVSPTRPPGLSYAVDFHVEVIVYQGPVLRPGLAIENNVMSGFSEAAVLLETDPPFGSYYRVIWTGTVLEADSEALAFLIEANASGALVDSIEIHTRYTLNKTPATVTLNGLNQLFDGNPKVVTATTVPPGLTVEVTYDGAPTPPTNTGSYEVVATVIDPVYAGSATGTLQIANETQTITFAAIPNQNANQTVSLSAGGGESGNPVIFEVTSGPAVIGPGNVLSFTGAGTVEITATQDGNSNYLPANPVTRTFTVSKAPATVMLSSLSQTYDGTPRTAGATTTPPGLTVAFTYDTNPAAPVAAGSYAVVATVNDAIYEGSASGTLVVGKASQTLLFPSIGNQLANASVNLAASGGGSGNPVTYAIDFGPAQIGAGNVLSFTGAGAVSITASQAGGPNHLAAPEVTRSFVVSKAPATVSLNSLNTTYDGTPKTAGATTVPAGLTVDFTYDGNPAVPTGAGDYTVIGTINDAIYEGSASGTLSIAKAAQTLAFAAIANQVANATVNLSATGGDSTRPVVFALDSGPAVLSVGNALTFTGEGEVSVTASQAGDENYLAAVPVTRTFTVSKASATVSLSGLGATYDGDPKSVTATTVPAGLTVNITYDGDPTAPDQAGSYAIEAVISDPVYEGGATGTLEIAKAPQAITFAAIADQVATATVNLSATGGDSANEVTFAVTAGPATIGAGNVLSFTGSGSVSITASQAGNTNYLAAPDVVRTFTVTKTNATITVTGLAQTYDGDPKPVTVTTVPAGLNVTVTYDGDTDAPVDAGSYPVVATIDDALYQGNSVKALNIAKAAQVISFPSIGNQLATATVNLSATGGGSGNPVLFEVTTGQADLAGGNVLTFPGAGAVSVTATQAGDGNHFPAPDVTRTFNVTKAAATVVLGDLTPTYDGDPKNATATTTPAGLTVNLTYNGSPTAPTDAGSYGVVATISDPIYEGSASGSFVIAKAPQVIDFPAIADQVATATVNLAATGGDSGNAVAFAVTNGPAVIGAGNALTFTGAGSVTITASQTGAANYLAATPVVRTFTVTKAPAIIVLTGLSHTYDGSAKAAGATTTPSGLSVSFTYEGNPAPPVAAGDYAVVGTIVDAIYEGSASGTLSIAKAAQSLNFPVIADQIATASVTLSASGGASGNVVTFAVTGGPAVIGAGNVLTFTGAGSVSITASQMAGPNHLAAPDVTRTFNVAKAPATVILSGLSHTYDGDAKVAGATTTPPGLAVTFTYDGLPAPPVGAGNYAVVATIDDAIYVGSVSGTLTIAKAAQEISFAAIPDQLVASVVNLSASGGGSGNEVTFAVTAGPGSITGGTILTFTTAGTVSVTASQAGGPNHLAAPDVTRTFEVDFSGYDAWRAAEFPGESDPLIIGVAARPNGQALANGYRYYLGNAVNDPSVLTSLGPDGGNWVFRHLRVEPAPADAVAAYEWSTDLVNWQGDGESDSGLTVDFIVTPGTIMPDGRIPVEVRAVPGGEVTDRLFVRLKLTVPVVLP